MNEEIYKIKVEHLMHIAIESEVSKEELFANISWDTPAALYILRYLSNE